LLLMLWAAIKNEDVGVYLRLDCRKVGTRSTRGARRELGLGAAAARCAAAAALFGTWGVVKLGGE